jgi:hypothetical protein
MLNFEFLLIFFCLGCFWLASPGSASCFKKATETPNAGHRLYYEKSTLRIEVVNGKKNICYSIFVVYLVTGTKIPDISH